MPLDAGLPEGDREMRACVASALGVKPADLGDVKLVRRSVDARKDAEKGKATIFGYYVEDPKRFGIMEFERGDSRTDSLKVISVEEKPKQPKSNYAIVGLYFYPKGVSDMADNVTPSARGELEITTLNDMYLQDGRLNAQLLGRGYTWMDAGTFDSLKKATDFVSMIEQYQGMTISSPEEIAYHLGWIDDEMLAQSVKRYGKSPYGERLKAVLEGKVVI